MLLMFRQGFPAWAGAEEAAPDTSLQPIRRIGAWIVQERELA